MPGRIHITLMLLILATGCTDGGGFAGALGGKGDAPKANAPEGDERPGDASEGMPGYLTDPSMVEIRRDEKTGEVTVNAPAGAILTPGGTPDRSRVVIWQVSKLELAKAQAVVSGTEIAGRLVNVIVPFTNGAFEGRFEVKTDDPFLVTTSPDSHKDGKILITEANEKTRAVSVFPEGRTPSSLKAASSKTGWTTANIAAAKTTWREKYGVKWTGISETETEAYLSCLIRNVMLDMPYAGIKAQFASDFASYIQNHIVVQCFMAALSVYSDDPAADLTIGKWNRRWYEEAVAVFVNEATQILKSDGYVPVPLVQKFADESFTRCIFDKVSASASYEDVMWDRWLPVQEGEDTALLEYISQNGIAEECEK